MRRTSILVVGVLIWCTALILLFHSQEPNAQERSKEQQLDKAVLAIEELQNQNKLLQKMIQHFTKEKRPDLVESKESSDAALIKMKSKLQACLDMTQNGKTAGQVNKENSPGEAENIDGMMARLATQQQAALIDVEDLNALNNEWRSKEAKELQDLVQKRIRYLQNPKDCSKARQLVCNLNKGCGFGCQVHHLAYCFMVAYGTQRTLIIRSKNWRYNSEGWEAVYLPASETCRVATGEAINWNGEQATKDIQTVSLPIVDGIINAPPYLPLGIPEDLAPRLLGLHGNPSVWWVGQFLGYLMRPQPWLQEDLDGVEKQSNFQHPIVGVHVRRTDKVGTEAAFHAIEEYMKHVIAWYDKYDLRMSKEKSGEKATRRVYLASDDTSVLPEARKMYPDYVFLGDTAIADSASLRSRYSKGSLRGVIVDIHFLSKCDYLSCTFSSQVCRVAYELMQTLHPDASAKFHSLDDIYYYGGQTGHEQQAVYGHEARSDTKEINMEVGDVVGIAGNHWDGYSKGIDKRTRKVGLYPSYKVKEIFKLVKYPTYPEANAT
ncbi:unnamed protein product [Clavelina lepadiformis]|uniref:Alpha-(1,6)-fucosyltransferase n=1 Tax=Clavelina lepadiformis TaxID=159417 RepID=A0ABP0GPA6_CLALP